MEGNAHGVLRLPSYILYDKDAPECEGSKVKSSEQSHNSAQSHITSGKARAASVLAWFGKMRGGSAKPPPAPPVLDVSPSPLGLRKSMLMISSQRLSSI